MWRRLCTIAAALTLAAAARAGELSVEVRAGGAAMPFAGGVPVDVVEALPERMTSVVVTASVDGIAASFNEGSRGNTPATAVPADPSAEAAAPVPAPRPTSASTRLVPTFDGGRATFTDANGAFDRAALVAALASLTLSDGNYDVARITMDVVDDADHRELVEVAVYSRVLVLELPADVVARRKPPTKAVESTSGFDAEQAVDLPLASVAGLAEAFGAETFDAVAGSPGVVVVQCGDAKCVRVGLVKRGEGKDAWWGVDLAGQFVTATAGERSVRVHVIPAVLRGATAERLQPRIVTQNVGSPNAYYAWRPIRLETSQLVFRRQPNACNSEITSESLPHGLTCDDLQVRMDVGTPDGRSVAGPWVPLTSVGWDRGGDGKPVALPVLETLAKLGDDQAIQVRGDSVDELAVRQLGATVWIAQSGSPAPPGRPDDRIGMKAMLTNTPLTIGWENRRRLTIAAFNAPAVTAINFVKCRDINAHGDGVDPDQPFGEAGTLDRQCAETPSRTLGTPFVTSVPVGVRLRFAPLFDDDRWGLFVDARAFELGVGGFTNPNREGLSGLVSAGSAGLGTDARLSLDEQPYFVFLRGAVNALLVDGGVRPRFGVELGFAIPLVSLRSDERPAERDKRKDKDEDDKPTDGGAP